MKTKPQANDKARDLRAKLQDMATLGAEAGERDNAKAKLTRLESRLDFTPRMTTADLFKGRFSPAPHGEAIPVRTFSASDYDIANAVKWAVETATRIPCLFRPVNGSGSQLCAQATPGTIKRLSEIAATIAGDFGALWHQYAAAGANPADRSCFVRGLFDGMMHETKPDGQPLPARATVAKTGRAKKLAVARPRGLELHPYSVALDLGRQIRFNTPLADIAAELDKTMKGELTA